MATVLISFIGKGVLAPEGADKLHAGYRKATYLFDDDGGAQEVTTPLFGAALVQRLRAQGRHADRWLVMGTEQSMWDALLDALPSELQDNVAELYLRLNDAVQQSRISQDLLDEWQQAICLQLPESDCRFRLVGVATDEAAQQSIWEAVSEAVETSDKIILDITNGFRHQPVIAAFMVMLLRWLRNVKSVELYYGALDMMPLNGGKAPVFRLPICNALLQATEAVATFRHTGNYSQLGECLHLSGNLDQKFQALVFKDGIQRDVTAEAGRLAKDLTAASSQPDAIRSSIAATLAEALKLAADKRLSERLYSKACDAFRHRQYFHAIALLYEAIRVAACDKYRTGGPDIHDNRKDAEKLLVEDLGYLTWLDKFTGLPVREVFERVSHLRHAVLHGTRGEYSAINGVLNSEKDFRLLFQAGLEVFNYVAPRRATLQSVQQQVKIADVLVESA